MITTKYVMSDQGTFAIVSKMTGMEHAELCIVGLGLQARDIRDRGSAGFLMLESDGSLTSYGRSESIGVDSRDVDGEIITAAIRDGRVRLEPMDGREEDYIAGNHASMMTEDLEIATLDRLQGLRVLGR